MYLTKFDFIKTVSSRSLKLYDTILNACSFLFIFKRSRLPGADTQEKKQNKTGSPM